MDECIINTISDLQRIYTIVLALAIGEAFKQFIPDAHRPIEERKLHWDQLLALVSFLLLVLPFFQGMSGHFFIEYHEGPMRDTYAKWLLLDCIAFTVEGALFFVLSRTVSARQWERFYFTVVLLLVVDGAWAFIELMFHDSAALAIRTWFWLDLVFLVLFGLALLVLRRRNYLLGAIVGLLLMLARSGSDYVLMWDFYFPAVRQEKKEPPKQEVQASADKTSIYIAASLFTQAEWQWNAALAARLRGLGFEVVLPQERAEPMLMGREAFDSGALFLGNVTDIERVDVLVAILDGADADSGTCWECGYAHKAGRSVIGLRTDLRGGGDDPKADTNLMLSESCSGFIRIPAEKRDDISWVSERIVEAVREELKVPGTVVERRDRLKRTVR